MDQKSVLLLGATGLVGSECLKLLCEDDFWNRVVALTRRPLPPEINHPKIETQVIDFDHPEKFRDVIKADQVMSALGTTIKKAGSQKNFYKVDFTYPFQIAKIALQNGAEHLLLVSSAGADAKSHIFYSRVKGELDEAVCQMGYRSVSIFRPSLLLGDRDEFRLGEEIAKFFGEFLNFAMPARYQPVHARAVAGTIIRVAKENQPGICIIESDEIQRN